jgi:RNA polymerase sigma factor (sigma-70 family)
MDNRHISRFIDHQRGRLMGRLRSRGVSTEEAEDGIQEASIKALGSITTNGAATEKQMLAWFTTTAYRDYLDEHKHAVTLDCVPIQTCEENLLSCPDDFIEQVESSLSIQQAWNRLSEQDKEVLILKSSGITCNRMADVLEINLEAAKKRLQTARRHFEQRLIASGIDLAAGGKRTPPRDRDSP